MNPWYFWSEDVWDKQGTNFNHATGVITSGLEFGHLDSLAQKPNKGFMKK